MPKEDSAAQAAEIERQEKALKEERESHQAERAEFTEAKARHEAEVFLEGLVESGKVLPKDKDGLALFMARLDDDETVAFGEGEAKGDGAKRTRRGFLRDFLTGLPKLVEFKEVSKKGDGEPVDFGEDPEKIAAAAVAFQGEQKAKGLAVSADQAVRHVLKGAES